MKVSVFGVGYVGLTAAVCFAEVGNKVIGVDINSKVVDSLNKSIPLIYEKGLKEILERNSGAKLVFTTDAQHAMHESDIFVMAVGTPSAEDGSSDLSQVEQLAKNIGQKLTKYALVIIKSTVPVGTSEKVEKLILTELQKRNIYIEFDVVFNPEFLKEGSAIEDFMCADRVIVGVNNSRAEKMMRQLYSSFDGNNDKIMVMDRRSAELTKYAANAMLATKISFMNEMSNLAERLGADIEKVKHGIGSDRRIGGEFISPGCGYGGSCFPKDLRALSFMAKEKNYNSPLINAVQQVNKNQKKVMFDKVYRYFGLDIQGLTFAIWGLSFKPNTDDIREAPSLEIISLLCEAGASVRVYDPMAMDNARKYFKDKKIAEKICFSKNAEDALFESEALIILTEWMEFRSPDFNKIKEKLRTPVIFDGRNILNLDMAKDSDLKVYGVGRGEDGFIEENISVFSGKIKEGASEILG